MLVLGLAEADSPAPNMLAAEPGRILSPASRVTQDVKCEPRPRPIGCRSLNCSISSTVQVWWPFEAYLSFLTPTVGLTVVSSASFAHENIARSAFPLICSSRRCDLCITNLADVPRRHHGDWFSAMLLRNLVERSPFPISCADIQRLEGGA